MTHHDVLDLFLEAARQHPERTAVEVGARATTYRGLAGRVLAAGAALAARGVEPEEPVVLAAADPEDVVTGMLAALHAGAAFVPCDPEIPAPRRRQMLERVRPRTVLAAASELPVVAGWELPPETRLVELPAAPSPAGSPAAPPPRRPMAPDALAYVTFTSGSTGAPKGIAGRLKAIDHFVRWEAETFAVGPGTRVSCLTTPAFDAFLRDAFTPLGHGGTMVAPARRGEVLRAGALAAWLEEARVHVLHCVPSVFRLLLQDLAPDRFPDLRVVLLAGEPVRPGDVGRWYGTLGERVRLVNLYGPSETVMTKLFEVLAPEHAELKTVPIGRPMPGVRALVVDARGRPCPPGTAGEIWIRTPYRSLGYYRDPEATRAAFVPNPFGGDDPDDLIYRTGDFGSLAPDGSFTLLGRRDDQVKVRGVRVELREVEAVLAAHPRVAEVAVVARDDDGDGLRLVAYVVGPAPAAELREHALAALPEPMVPSFFVAMDALPRTLTGKVDRRALPAPRELHAGAAPVDPTEALMARLWADLLRLPEVGPQDRFFEIGGQSLAAMRMLGRVQEVFGVDVPLRALFDESSLRGFTRLVRGARRQGPEEPRPVRRRRYPAAPLPLTPAQRSIWLARERRPEREEAWHVGVALHFEGLLDPGLLRTALAEVIDAHEALRLGFGTVDGQPVQRVAPAAEPAVALDAVTAEGLDAWLGELALRPFDLGTPPLLRAGIARLGPREHVLALVVHHLVTDAWGLERLWDDLAARLRAGLPGTPTAHAGAAAGTLPGGPPEAGPRATDRIDFGDYVAWQAQRLPEASRAGLAVLARRLAGYVPLDLGALAPPGTGGGRVHSGRRPIAVEAPLADAVKALARTSGTTPFLVLCAGVHALLHRLTGRGDTVVGTAVANRVRPELEPLVGLFANTLALRVRPQAGESFAALLRQVREIALEAWAHQEVPYDEVVAAVRPQGDQLAQVMLVLQDAAADAAALPGLTVTPRDVPGGGALFPLTLELAPRGGGYAGTAYFDPARFDGDATEAWWAALVRLLAESTADPERPIGRIPLLDPAVRQLWREQGAAAAPPPFRDANLHQLFEAAAARRPDAVAVVAGEARWTYRRLAAEARTLAGRLAAEAPGCRLVGVLCRRDPWWIAAQLAVLATGAAYLPLDPDLPAPRLTQLTAGMDALLHAEGLDLEGWQGPTIDLHAAAGPSPAASWRPAGVPAEAPAYVMYTSGSTGRPKGTVVPHRAVIRLVLGTDYVELGPQDVVAQAANASFDAATFEVWGALFHGARLVILPREDVLEPARLADGLRHHRVTTLFLTTGLFDQVAAVAPETFDGLSHLLMGGQRVDPASLRRVRERATGPARLLHVYGPTENTTFSTWHLVDAVPRDATTVPIGRPVAHSTAVVLDPAFEESPPYAVGELCVGGDGLAQGYLGDPRQTAQRFVPAPGAGEPGARLYRTGDLVRRLPDGGLVFVGRADRQVKIRGFRIEPGEVEARLLEHPGVRTAAVDVRGTPARLVAWVVPAGDPLDPASLRRHLEERLPAYMVPQAVVTVDALPLDVNGKVRVADLEVPEPRPAQDAAEPPRDGAERVLAGIWRELLGTEPSRDDDYFQLGGDSIQAIQLVARCRRAGLALQVRDVFAHPQLAALAERAAAVDESPAEEAGGGEGTAGEAAASGAGSRTVPLTPIQRWFAELRLPASDHFLQAVRLRAAAPLDREALRRALEQVAARHDALRLRWPADPPPLEELELGGGATVEMVELPDLDAPSLGGLPHRIDLRRGPLLVAAVSPREPAQMLLAAHHLAVDVVSWGILIDELESVYGALRAGRAAELPPVPTSWAEYARRAAALGTPPAAGPEPEDGAARLPGTGARGTVADERRVDVELTRRETAAWLARGSGGRHLGDALLLTAVALALRPDLGGGDLAIARETHGRDRVPGLDLTRTVGWLTAILPLRLRAVPGDPAATVDGIVRALAATEDAPPTAGAAAEISFNHLGNLDRALAPGGHFALAAGALPPLRAAGQPRPYRLDVSASVEDGRLRMSWSYGAGDLYAGDVERWAEATLDALRRLVNAPAAAGTAVGTAASDEAGLEGEPFPLTPVQAGMLFHHLERPHDDPYVIQLAWTLEGDLDAAALAAAWSAVTAAHPVLRTSFAWDGGEPVQRVHAAPAGGLEVRDATGLDPEAAQAAARRLFADERRRGFDLARPPLHRPVLLRTAAGGVLLWTLHHLVVDGWSAGVVLEQVWRTYAALVRGAEPPRLQAPPFRDYVAWLGTRGAGEARRWWREQLAGAALPTSLPGLRRGAEPDAPLDEFLERGATLSPGASGALQAAARGHGLTLATAVQLAWALVLARFSGRDDVVFGMVSSGRPPELPGVEEMVGPLLATQPVRARLASSASLADLGRELQRQQVEAGQHPVISLAELRAALGLAREEPLFDSVLLFENYPAAAAPDDGLGLDAEPCHVWDRTHYPFTLTIVPGRDALALRTSADPGRLGATAAETLTDALLHVLAELPAALARPAAALDALPPALRRELLDGARGPRREIAGPTVWHRFRAAAERHPEAGAVLQGSSAWSYADLLARVEALAAGLRRRGVGPGSTVAVALPRVPELPAALLAVAAAGAAWLPLDPSHPRARLLAILADAGVDLALVDDPSWLPEDLPRWTLAEASGAAPDDGAPAAGEQAAGEQAHRDLPGPSPEDLAYAIFTSGSTGRPKGVLVPHGALANHLDAMGALTPLAPGDRLVAVTTPSFDIAVLELLLPLVHGAAVAVATEDEVRSPAALAALLAAADATALQATPVTWQALLDTGWQPPPGFLALCGGEAMPPALAARLAATGARAWNLYGPTEATVWTSAWAVDGGPVSLGTPLANTSLHVLDAELRPCPPGVAGEVFLGGRGLAWGYAGLPARTAAAFVPDPFADGPGADGQGARLYRTGDLARREADGRIAYLGRRDLQVKVRGFRVELEEIDAALAAVPGVRHAVVDARPDGEVSHRLVAWLVGTPSPEREIRARLSRSLPAYLVPSRFLWIDRLPLTASGKVDRRALPMDDGSGEHGPATADAAAAGTGTGTEPISGPRDALELAVADLVAAVLERPRPGPADDLFHDLGMHSLDAIRVVGRLRAELDPAFTLPSLLAAPTVAGVAAALRAAAARVGRPAQGGRAARIVPLQRAGSGPPLFLVHAAVGDVLGYLPLARHLGAGRPVLGLRAPGVDGGEPPLDSVGAIAEIHVEALRAAQPDGPYLVAGHSFGGLVAWEIVHRLRERGAAVERLVLLDCAVPDPGPPPPRDDAAWLADTARVWERLLGRPLGVDRATLAGLAPEDGRRLLLERLGAAGLLPAGVGAEFVQAMLAVQKAAAVAAAGYRPPPTAVPVTLIRAGAAAAEDLERLPAAAAGDPSLGWRGLCTDLEILEAPGDHVTMLAEPRVRTTAALLASVVAGSRSEV